MKIELGRLISGAELKSNNTTYLVVIRVYVSVLDHTGFQYIMVMRNVISFLGEIPVFSHPFR